jgi:hypothetical protein
MVLGVSVVSYRQGENCRQQPLGHSTVLWQLLSSTYYSFPRLTVNHQLRLQRHNTRKSRHIREPNQRQLAPSKRTQAANLNSMKSTINLKLII